MIRQTYEEITTYTELARARHMLLQAKLDTFTLRVKEAQDYLAEAKAYLANISTGFLASPSNKP